MTVITPAPASSPARIRDTTDLPFSEAEVAAAFLARYHDPTLSTYRTDLRVFFEWADGAGINVLAASRPQIELFVRALEDRGLAASTIDRRLSTVCGFYRFAHIDGRIASNPAQYVRRPRVHPPKPEASTGPSSAPSCSPPNGSTRPTPA